MKKSKVWILIVSTVAVLLAGCEKENENQANNTSGGIVTQDDVGIELNLDNYGYGVTISFQSPKVYISDVGISTDLSLSSGYVDLKMGANNNFRIVENSGPSGLDASISKFGNVSGISAITSVPSSGWVKEIAVNPGSGYVVRYRGRGFNYTYARIYVKSWITNTLGEIIGATVIYQDKWGKEQGSPNLTGCVYQCTASDDAIVFQDATTGNLNNMSFNYTIVEWHGTISLNNSNIIFVFDNYDENSFGTFINEKFRIFTKVQ